MFTLRTLSSSLRSPKLLIPLALLIAAVVLILNFVRFNIEGDFEGLYLLRGTNGYLYEVRDDLFLGEFERLIYKVESERLQKLLTRSNSPELGDTHLSYKWHKSGGHGYVESFFQGGKKLIFCFGRFLDSDNKVPHGLFVGGGLPFSKYEHSEVKANETGMAYFDGKEWQHIWCNANEALAGGNTPEKMIFPSSWEFLGSNVLYSDRRQVVLKSSHKALVEGVPLRIDRYAFLRAGDTYFLMAIKITNIGNRPASYYYVYGDEPWLGEYGTSVGNVGWTADRLYYYETAIDTRKYNWFGMFDGGNKVVPGEKGDFTNLSNFIEWLGMVRPEVAYFSNKEGKYANEAEKVPLYSKDNRVLFAQWGPRPIAPDQSETIIMAIGMGTNGPKDPFPKKPEVVIDWEKFNYALAH